MHFGPKYFFNIANDTIDILQQNQAKNQEKIVDFGDHLTTLDRKDQEKLNDQSIQVLEWYVKNIKIENQDISEYKSVLDLIKSPENEDKFEQMAVESEFSYDT